MKNRLQIDIVKLDRELAAQGWDDLRLASESGLHPDTIANLRAAETGHSPGTLWAIAGALGVKVADLAQQPNRNGRKR